MAPIRPPAIRDVSIDPTPEYEEFINDLKDFHEKRGTFFDPQPKVGTRRVDLLKLYKRVTGDGGYDDVSNTKKNKLAWRKLGQEFQLGAHNLPILAFSLKTLYYKNLVAYEITKFHNKEPPPKEILEDVTAKGGDVMNRTLENFQRFPVREDVAVNGDDAEETEMDLSTTTPKGDKMDLDESESASGRATRGLRQAPPQRVLFQSDTSTSRQPRQSSGSAQSPAPQPVMYPTSNGTHTATALSGSLANYDPKPQVPLSLRPVITPGNNAEAFRNNQKLLRERALARLSKSTPPVKGMMLPGTGYPGHNIYMRTLLALQSGILDEEEYALHHLVRISHERGDKYRFDNFAGLADALIGKVLQITPMLYGVEWQVVYSGDETPLRGFQLDGINGTTDILERMEALVALKIVDKIETEDFSRKLLLINEAGLVIRNMVMLDANAESFSRNEQSKDFIVILLNLPPLPQLVELQQYAIETAEQLTKYFDLPSTDPLFKSLLKYAESKDRGAIISSLKAISRMGINLEHAIALEGVPVSLIQRICDWLLVEDEGLRQACLDLLYRYSSSPPNVEVLLRNINMEGIVNQLVRMLMHGSHYYERREHSHKSSTHTPRPSSRQQVQPSTNDTPIPIISADLIEQLLGYDEPERSSQWLRCCFEEEADGEITQLALWKSYQIPFAPFAAQRPLLPAKDFITNVSNTFHSASAQVMNDPGAPRFIIKGIRPRRIPVDPKGRPYMRCLWHMTDEGEECGGFALWPKHMWEHIAKSHLGIPKNPEDGTHELSRAAVRHCECRWAGCDRFPKGSATPFEVGMHVKTHLPDTSERAYQRSKHNRFPPMADAEPSTPYASSRASFSHPPASHIHAPSSISSHLSAANAATQHPSSWPTQNTPIEPSGEPAGLPHLAVLTLRSLARNIPRTEAGGADNGATLWGIFAPVREQLFWVLSVNETLRVLVADLLGMVERAAVD